MQRRIEYRVWDKEEGKILVDGFDIYYEECFGLFSSKEDKNGDWLELPLMEYTNKIDIEGNKIYEGDIIECWDEYGFLTNFNKVYIFIIEYYNNCLSAKYHWDFN